MCSGGAGDSGGQQAAQGNQPADAGIKNVVSTVTGTGGASGAVTEPTTAPAAAPPATPAASPVPQGGGSGDAFMATRRPTTNVRDDTLGRIGGNGTGVASNSGSGLRM